MPQKFISQSSGGLKYKKKVLVVLVSAGLSPWLVDGHLLAVPSCDIFLV